MSPRSPIMRNGKNFPSFTSDLQVARNIQNTTRELNLKGNNGIRKTKAVMRNSKKIMTKKSWTSSCDKLGICNLIK